MKKRLYGFLLTIALSLLIIILFFGDMLSSPGTVLFDASGDGFTSYFSAAWHTRHDSLAFRNHGMNYPFGEMILYTGSQPLVTQPVRFLSDYFLDLSGQTVALVNLAVIVSLVLGMLFLWLIFMELGVAWWYAALVSAGMTLLSPQLATLNTVFTLAWTMWIPLTAYLLIRFDRTRRLHYTFFLGLVTCAAALHHAVFTGLIAVMTGGYWFFRFFWYRQARTFWYRDAIHIFFQFVLPVLLVQLSAMLNDDVTDRSIWPCIPGTDPAQLAGAHGPFSHLRFLVPGWINPADPLQPHVHPWIGTVAWVGMIAGIGWIVQRIRTRQPVLRITHISALNVLFWVSLLGLVASVAMQIWIPGGNLPARFPFLVQMQLPLSLPWLFYYILNIALFSALYERTFSGDKKWYRKALAIVAMLVLITEGFVHTRKIAGTAMVEESGLDLAGRDESSWSETLGAGAFQAILPVPGFHTGSGNIRYNSKHPVIRHAMMASLATGLPVTGADLSRTSLSQTWNQVAVYLEPLERLEFPDFLPDEKPLLLLLMKNYTPTEQEHRLIEHALYLTETPDFMLYELQVPVLRRLNLIYKQEVVAHFEQSALYGNTDWRFNDPAAWFRQISFDKGNQLPAFEGTGSFVFPAKKDTVVWRDTMQPEKAVYLNLSFWTNNFRQDGVLCARYHIQINDKLSGQAAVSQSGMFSDQLKAFSGEWALIEIPFEVPAGNYEIVFSVLQDTLPEGDFALDELMVRQEGSDVFRREGRMLWWNNRRMIVR